MDDRLVVVLKKKGLNRLVSRMIMKQRLPKWLMGVKNNF